MRRGTFTDVCHIPVELTGDYGVTVDGELVARYTFHPPCKGSTDGRFGPKIEPDEPEHVEIESVILRVGSHVMSDAKIPGCWDEDIEEKCFEHATEGR